MEGHQFWYGGEGIEKNQWEPMEYKLIDLLKFALCLKWILETIPYEVFQWIKRFFQK